MMPGPSSKPWKDLTQEEKTQRVADHLHVAVMDAARCEWFSFEHGENQASLDKRIQVLETDFPKTSVSPTPPPHIAQIHRINTTRAWVRFDRR